MPSIEQAITIAYEVTKRAPSATFMFRGPPGSGKSMGALGVGDRHGLPKGRQLVVHINNHDVVDFTGVPSVVDGQTVFNPTEMFYKFREGTGPGLIVLEEIAQAPVSHQTWAAGFILERETATFKLDPGVIIISTGNRAEDKAGAKPLLTHLANRMYIMDIDTSVDDYSSWALANQVDPMGVAFLRLRPGLLNDFNPNRQINPTQRAWTQLFTEVPNSLPTDLYFQAAAAKVGEGPAAEWVAAKDMMAKMPSVDYILLQPASAEIPTEPAVRFAVATSLAMRTTDESNFDRAMQYIERMPKEFQMLYVSDVVRQRPKVQQTGAFIKWALANKDTFMNTK